MGREAALADAKHCLANLPEPFVRYQLAGVYTHLSRKDPAMSAIAFDLLRSALKDGSGFDWLPTDADLDPIREHREFREILEAVKTLTPSNRR